MKFVENPKEKVTKKMFRLKENGNSYGDISKSSPETDKTKSGKNGVENVHSVMKTYTK